MPGKEKPKASKASSRGEKPKAPKVSRDTRPKASAGGKAAKGKGRGKGSGNFVTDSRFPVEKDPRFARLPRSATADADARFSTKDSKFLEPTVTPYGDRAQAEDGAFHWDAVSSSSEEEEEEEDEEVDTHVWDQPGGAVEYGDASARIAVMGADWDRADATDLFALVRTFLEAEGKVASDAVKRAVVYVSQYGQDQLALEAEKGPAIGATEDEEQHDTAVREYQKQRLKYFFGVVECNSAETAAYLYDELDGMFVEDMTPHGLELQFVPDDLEIPYEVKDDCKQLPADYAAPTGGKAGALGHTRAECTWDGDFDKKRIKKMTKRYSEKELAEFDLDAYLASSDEEDEIDEDNLEDYRRQLLGDAADLDSEDEDQVASAKPKKRGEELPQELDITYNPVVNAMAEKVEAKAKALKGSGGLGKKGLGSVEDNKLGPWDKYLAKRKEKKKLQKEEWLKKKKRPDEDANEPPPDKKWRLPSTVVDMNADSDADADADASDPDDGRNLLDSGDEDRHFDVKKRTNRGSKRTAAAESSAAFTVDTADKRIGGVFDNPDFAIDPTNPEYRDSQAMREVLTTKRRKARTAPLGKATKPAQVNESPAPRKAKKAKTVVEEGFSIF